jgi:hypothetical protein
MRRKVRKRKNQTTIAVRADSAHDFERRIGLLRPKAAVLNSVMDMVNNLPDAAVDPFMRAIENGARNDHAGLAAAMTQVCQILTSPGLAGSPSMRAGERPPVVGEIGRPSDAGSPRPKSRGGPQRKANHQ